MPENTPLLVTAIAQQYEPCFDTQNLPSGVSYSMLSGLSILMPSKSSVNQKDVSKCICCVDEACGARSSTCDGYLRCARSGSPADSGYDIRTGRSPAVERYAQCKSSSSCARVYAGNFN